ncbi:class I SAM-dependent methyltransferase [Nocardia arizonensis]|uniref:class I SAM-dependent methyltransferase n=1 Tax=Nocardia arizonensis TaxID=1141647 RepID=UPI0006D04BB1|nr:class I SAM-dependent methyltransferase [Nocardia arizonensis]
MSTTFDRALTGAECWLRAADGTTCPLPTRRWLGDADPGDLLADHAMVSLCGGPTIDLGCGPGRLVAALVRRGVVALGVDISPTAVAIARRRGAPALRRDVLGPLPGTGRWSFALLADGNIGIGADPARLLARIRRLLVADGIAVVEFDRPGTGMNLRRLRLETPNSTGAWFPWAHVGMECAAPLARATGFRVRASIEVGGRHIAVLQRAPLDGLPRGL